MNDLNVQLCPETGICSIVKPDGKKIDLMPDEVNSLRDVSGDQLAIKRQLADIDSAFADGLDPEQLEQVSARLK
jgi:hypothetical protein